MLEVAGIGCGQWVSDFGCIRGSNSEFSSAKPSSSAKSSPWWALELLEATFGGFWHGSWWLLCKIMQIWPRDEAIFTPI